MVLETAFSSLDHLTRLVAEKILLKDGDFLDETGNYHRFQGKQLHGFIQNVVFGV
jgi:hypothetical protein